MKTIFYIICSQRPLVFELAYGTEESFQAFREDVKINGYDTTLERAKEYYQNPNVEKDINRTLMNAYYGESQTVDSVTEAAVEKAMIQSFEERYLDRNMKMDGQVLEQKYDYNRSYCAEEMEFEGND